jgi:CheY-like chemotaxis protein
MNVITLIVDDDIPTQLIHKKALEHAMITSNPFIFQNGEEALNYLLDNYQEENKYLVFLDITMPVMDGWMFLDEIDGRFSAGNIHVIIVTSSISVADRTRANAYRQVLKYLLKPVSLDSLKLMNQFLQVSFEYPLE